MNGLILIGAGLLAAGVTFITNWLALIPWRRSRDQHWSEQARLLCPARAAARSSLLTVPGINALAVLLVWPDSSPLWVFVGLVSLFGAYAGTLPLDHEIFPRIPFRDLLRQAAIGILLRFLMWFVFISATISMPDEFNQMALGIGGMVVGLCVIWSRGGLIWLGRKSDLQLVRAALKRSRVVALFGPRQSGKTTLARQFVPADSLNYFDLDRRVPAQTNWRLPSLLLEKA